MSTIILRDEILQVADALYCDAMGARNYLHTVIDEPAHPLKFSIEDEKSLIYAWVNRLYVANQIAFIFTYSHKAECDRKIALFDEQDIWHDGAELIQNPARWYRRLQSIGYNIISNGGQCMLCREDMERLHNLAARIASEVIGDYQRERKQE
jgi:hypothetical protein